VEERDELEIETRLRAALQARSELVTHSTLRPGIPPNEHTAGVRAQRDAWWSWRRLWVPVTVAAALAGGVFVGAQLPSGSDQGQTSAASGPTPNTVGGTGTSAAEVSPSGSTSSGSMSTGHPTADSSPVTLNTVAFSVAGGWQLTNLDDTSACVTPKTRPAPPTAGDAGAKAALPCGVDALYLKIDATPDTWPLDAATKATGWWPGDAASASDITCPAAKSGSSDMVKDSTVLRSSPKYALGGQTTAEYHEWAVTCDTGSGVQPMLWKINPIGTAAGGKSTVAMVVSADPAYDSALLGMVGTLHQAG
jgi:hypothetical protein